MKMMASLLPTTLLLTSLLILTITVLIIPPTDSFQTPIIFPLLWLSKRLTIKTSSNHHQKNRSNDQVSSVADVLQPSQHARYRRRRQQLPSISLTPILSALANTIATKTLSLDSKTKQRENNLIHWITQESSDSSSTIRSNIRIDNHPKTQIRGLFAQRDIRSNELIVEVPYHVALLVGDNLNLRQDIDCIYNTNHHASWDEGDVEDVLQGLYFLENFVKGASFQHESTGREYSVSSQSTPDTDYEFQLDCEYYAPYVTSLPPKPIDSDSNSYSYDKEEGLTPDFWSDSTIDEIGIPTYTQRILDRKRILQTIAQNNNVDESDLQWATFLIRSRRFTTWNMVPDPMYDIEEGGGGGGPFGAFPTAAAAAALFNQKKKIEQIQGFLVPLIDMANHNPNPNAEMNISVNKWTRKFDETSSFALRATRPIRKGEEITISYGDGSSTCLELLDKYGFFVEGDEDGADERGLVDLEVAWGTSVEEDEVELDRLVRGSVDSSTVSSSSSKLKTIVSRLQDEYTFNFPLVLENNEEMKLIGSGIREKLGINVYAVGMYGSPSLLNAVSPSDLRYKARQFVSSSSDVGSGMTSFVLEMILQAEGKVIAEAIADSVGVRYDGSRLDVEQLENLINVQSS